MRPLALLLLLPACTWVGPDDWEQANDRDRDGYTTALNGGYDCDDDDASIHPGADEICDGKDQDCDGLVDEDPIDATIWYLDDDDDGYGAEQSIAACVQPDGTSPTGDDCDDGDASTHPRATEWCDGLDTDCDGTEDPAGIVSFVDASGTWTDLTDSFQEHSIASVYELSTDGTLFFCPGSYVGLISVSAASATIVGRGGSASTTLSGGSDGPVISAATGAAELTIAGLTLTDGDGGNGGGISSTIAGLDLTGQDLVITECEADLGGGLYLEGAVLDLSEVTLSSNSATQGGGGLYALSCSGEASGLWVTGNVSATDGGGLGLRSTALEFGDSLVNGNESGGRGGGIAAWDRSTVLTMDATLVQDNDAEYGAGLYIDDAVVTCSGASEVAAGFHNNVATSSGGGIFVDGNQASFTATACDFGTGEDDNDPDDVFTEKRGRSYQYADDVDLECDYDSCW